MPPTRRRTNKTPPHKVMARMFPTVPKYFDWIMHSAAKVTKREREERLRNEGVLCAVLGSVLVKACKESVKVERYFHVGDVTPMKNAVRELLVKEAREEYSLRLYLRHIGPRGTYQMQTGYPHDIAKGSALLRINQSLTIEERHTVQRLLQPCLDGSYVSPSKMASWLVPVLLRAIKKVNRKVISGHSVRAFPLHSKQGLSAVIVCMSKSDRQTFTAKVTFDLGVQIQQLPRYYKIPQPYPKHLRSHTHRGRELAHDIRTGFENGEQNVCLTFALAKRKNSAGMTLPVLGPRSKTIISGLNVNMIDPDHESGLKSSSLQTFNNAKSEKAGTLWRIDYRDLEKYMSSVIRHQASFRVIQEALRLYTVLSTCGGKVLPPLCEDAKRSLALWLYKQSDHTIQNLMTAFTALLELSGACIQNKFCPSFCDGNVNTMARMLLDEEEEEEEMGSEVISLELGSGVIEIKDKEENNVIRVKEKDENNVLKLFRIIEEDDVTKALELLKIC